MIMRSELKPTTANLPDVLVKEIDDIVAASSKYRSRSHFFQVAAERLVAEEARAVQMGAMEAAMNLDAEESE
jgi:metal-responsive CopG/Arc/MetJ family transcriptional regulator